MIVAEILALGVMAALAIAALATLRPDGRFKVGEPVRRSAAIGASPPARPALPLAGGPATLRPV